MRSMQTRVIALIAVGLVSAALASGRTAARDKDSGEGGGLDSAAIDKLVVDTLREVINRGADLYNGGEWTSCYRLYEGALMTTKPLLKHRPGLQKAIADGLVNAERDPASWRRAFVLRAVLDKVRKEIRPEKIEKKETEKKETEKKEAEKKEPEKKEPEKKEPDKEKKEPDKEKKEPKKKGPDEAASIKGKVTINGVALEVGLVTFHPPAGEAVTAVIDADGNYEVQGVKAGRMKLSVATAELLPKVGAPPRKAALVNVPRKYHDPNTSGLTINLVRGEQVFDVALIDE